MTLRTAFVAGALVGLFGSDRFGFAVSADGSTFFDELGVDNTNGTVDVLQVPRTTPSWSGERAGRLAERRKTAEKANDVQRRKLEAEATSWLTGFATGSSEGCRLGV
ncbi:hypothetical protein [Antarctobacter heliothermus]|uniref:hypothetical protein n=1 Tax=Antarctobacter heliothermus TaxID=74033 RepID=UPI0014839A70|nr:hypothetical protein [Antarctobacter heliothermus]